MVDFLCKFFTIALTPWGINYLKMVVDKIDIFEVLIVADNVHRQHYCLVRTSILQLLRVCAECLQAMATSARRWHNDTLYPPEPAGLWNRSGRVGG